MSGFRPPRATRLFVVDVVLAIVLAAVEIPAVIDPPERAFDGPQWLALLLPCLAAALILPRRRWPLGTWAAVLCVVAAATVTGAVGAGVVWLAYLPLCVVLYTAAERLRPLWAVVTLAVSVMVAAAAILSLYRVVLPGLPPSEDGGELPLAWPVDVGMVTVALCVAATIGLAVAWRRRVAADVTRRTARQAVADERLRIARDLHDVVGHSLSLISIKATVANHIAEQRPQESRDALRVIETTSRETLTEIRRVLGVLRTDPDSPAATGDLDRLVADFAATGVTVEVTRRGDRRLPETVAVTVHRIVREALTNVARHAGTGRCRLLVDATDTAVTVEVSDDGRGRSPGAPGYGLIGMRERVAVFGGRLTAGPRPGGGFTVRAEIPLDDPKGT